MKKSFVLAMIMVFIFYCIVPNTSYANGYSDITNHWAKEYIISLAEKNIISGYSDGTFKPNSNITVAEFTKLVFLSSGVKIADSKPWYKSIIDSAMETGLIKSDEFDNYDKRLITRGEMARMIVRQLGVDSPKVETTSFKDDKQIPQNLKGYIKAASDKQIITGLPNGNFDAHGYATRGEAATMIYRMLKPKKLTGPELPVPMGDFINALNETEFIFARPAFDYTRVDYISDPREHVFIYDNIVDLFNNYYIDTYWGEYYIEDENGQYGVVQFWGTQPTDTDKKDIEGNKKWTNKEGYAKFIVPYTIGEGYEYFYAYDSDYLNIEEVKQAYISEFKQDGKFDPDVDKYDNWLYVNSTREYITYHEDGYIYTMRWK